MKLGPVLNPFYVRLTGATRTAVEFSFCLNPVADDAIAAMFALGC